MCTLTGTRYHQCANHFITTHITHCSHVDKLTWTCPMGNQYVVAESERVCPSCARSLVDSARNLAFKME